MIQMPEKAADERVETLYGGILSVYLDAKGIVRTAAGAAGPGSPLIDVLMKSQRHARG